MAFRVFGIAAAVFGLAVGLVDVVTGVLRGNVWQALAGVALTFLAAVLLLTLDDARTLRGVRARWVPDLPDDGVFALGVRMRGRDGAFRPLLVHVRTRKRGDWWMALECTPGQLRELAGLLRPYAVGETDEPVGQSGAEAGVVPACTLDRLLGRIRFGRLFEERVDVVVGRRHEADPTARGEYHGDDARDGRDHGGQGLDPVPPVLRQDAGDPVPIHATNATTGGDHDPR